MPGAVIVDAVRTPIGRARRGALRDVRADDLAATALSALVERNPDVDFDATDDVVMGCGFALGEQGHNLARNAALLAGLHVRVPGTTVNRFCASSLQALAMAFHAVRAGAGRQYVTGGAESVSRLPEGPRYDRHPRLDGSAGALHDVYVPMGVTAENVARARGVSRAAQDEWALESQSRAVAARDAGHFDAETVAVELPDGRRVTRDDGPRPDTTLEGLAALEPAFEAGGTVTAGNACPLNDGAAAVLVTSDARAGELGVRPRARILASAVAGVEPELMGLGPLPAVARVLDLAGMTLRDVDVVELNEAFAAQVIACQREWELDPARLNPYGGAIALGHPFGMSGARLVTTLLHGLEARDETIGLAALCAAGGMGQALLIERLS